VLAIIAKRWPRSDTSFTLEGIAQDLEIQGSSYSADEHEVTRLREILRDNGDFCMRPDGREWTLSVKGLLAAEALSASGSNSAQGFVAMWFDDTLSDAWLNGFHPGISAAGFRPLRIDAKDYVGGVSDEIMAEIRGSRFVVADYTGHRGGVYFEAGFAIGLGLKVIPTCRADDLSDLHFDIKHLNTLLWNNPAELADKLSKRIRAVVGTGPDAIDKL
jgi:hypothetical protein